jgi:hypothetical protein
VPKLNVEITTYPAIADFEVKAGDQIMVFDGKALGVYTGRDPLPKMTPKEAGKIGGMTRAKNAPPKESIVKRKARMEEDMKRILEALRVGGPGQNIMQIGKHLGTYPGEKDYARLSYVLRVLRDKGKVSKEGKNTNMVYSLAA